MCRGRSAYQAARFWPWSPAESERRTLHTASANIAARRHPTHLFLARSPQDLGSPPRETHPLKAFDPDHGDLMDDPLMERLVVTRTSLDRWRHERFPGGLLDPADRVSSTGRIQHAEQRSSSRARSPIRIEIASVPDIPTRGGSGSATVPPIAGSTSYCRTLPDPHRGEASGPRSPRLAPLLRRAHDLPPSPRAPVSVRGLTQLPWLVPPSQPRRAEFSGDIPRRRRGADCSRRTPGELMNPSWPTHRPGKLPEPQFPGRSSVHPARRLSYH